MIGRHQSQVRPDELLSCQPEHQTKAISVVDDVVGAVGPSATLTARSFIPAFASPALEKKGATLRARKEKLY